MEHTGFPSEETLAAFIDGRLDAETRRRVVEHMADCADCRGAWLGGREWGRGLNVVPIKSPSRFGWRALTSSAVGVAAVAAIILMLPIRLWYQQHAASREMAALASEANDLPVRTIEARLSGGFAYRPVAETVRGDSGDSRHDAFLWKVSVIAVGDTVPNPSIAQLHTRGAASLLLGEVDNAVASLSEALQKESEIESRSTALIKSRDSALLNDLSAAYYQRYLRKQNAADIRLAAEAAEQSWSTRPSGESAWNRALIFAVTDRDKGKAAWLDYLRFDSSSPWAAEAKIRLRSLSTDPRKSTDR